jgi:hypothetical protein
MVVFPLLVGYNRPIYTYACNVTEVSLKVAFSRIYCVVTKLELHPT